MRPLSTKSQKQKNPSVHIVFSEIPMLDCNAGLPIITKKKVDKRIKIPYGAHPNILGRRKTTSCCGRKWLPAPTLI